jgi:hypothetical protein
VLTALLLSGNVSSIEQIDIELGRLSGAEWSMQDVTLQLIWGEEGGVALHLQGRQLSHLALSTPLDTFQLECPNGMFWGAKIICNGGRFSANLPGAKSFSFHLDLEASSVAGKWQLKLQAKAIDLRRAHKMLASLKGMRLRGKIDLSLEMSGDEGEGASTLLWQIQMRNLSFNAGDEYLG